MRRKSALLLASVAFITSASMASAGDGYLVNVGESVVMAPATALGGMIAGVEHGASMDELGPVTAIPAAVVLGTAGLVSGALMGVADFLTAVAGG